MVSNLQFVLYLYLPGPLRNWNSKMPSFATFENVAKHVFLLYMQIVNGVQRFVLVYI